MKKLVILAAWAATFGLAHAQSSYIGGAVGDGHINVSCPGGISCSDNHIGFKVYAGYKFATNLSAELTYFDLGRANIGGDTIKASAIGLGLAYTVPLSAPWDLALRLGVADAKSKDNWLGSQSSTKLYAGLGFGYALSPAVKLTAAVDFLSVKRVDGESAGAQLYSLGLESGF